MSRCQRPRAIHEPSEDRNLLIYGLRQLLGTCCIRYGGGGAYLITVSSMARALSWDVGNIDTIPVFPASLLERRVELKVLLSLNDRIF